MVMGDSIRTTSLEMGPGGCFSGSGRIAKPFGRVIGSLVAFAVSSLIMLVVCTWAWDEFVNGKLYYCTDGGSMDFICGGGGWVDHPVSVAKVVPHRMEEPDEIKQGWSSSGLTRLWYSFALGSVLLSALVAGVVWKAASPKPTIEPS